MLLPESTTSLLNLKSKEPVRANRCAQSFATSPGASLSALDQPPEQVPGLDALATGAVVWIKCAPFSLTDSLRDDHEREESVHRPPVADAQPTPLLPGVHEVTAKSKNIL